MYTLSFSTLHEYDPGGTGITLPVELSLGTSVVKATAKVDPGASLCIFRRECGEELGIDIESGTPERVSTVTGSFIAYGHNITLNAAGFQFDVTVYFAEMYNLSRNVLGRYGWMQLLKIGIVDYDGKLYLGKYDGEA